MIALIAKRLYTPNDCVENPLLLIEDDRIVEVTSGTTRHIPTKVQFLNFPDCILAPGFVDIHIHGGGGYDVMDPDASALPAVERLIAKHGVTSYLPTTVTAPLDQTLSALDRLAEAIETAERNTCVDHRAQPLGIHLEGPFISHARRGVHPPSNLLPPTIATFERFWQASRGRIRVMTIAPELEGSLEVITEAVRRNVCVSLGHSDADLSATQKGIAAGARHATHTFNAMRPLDHREPGIVGAVLSDDRVSADIIADGIHLHPVTVDLFLKKKGSESSVLITDATAATGMPDGRYRLGSFEVEVKQGRCIADGKLAGSVLTMDQAVRNVMQFADWDLQQAVRLATANAARVAGLQRGKLEPGGRADVVVLTATGQVTATIIGGVLSQAASQG